jgi:crossover junction endodeoxyribonuclease RusA
MSEVRFTAFVHPEQQGSTKGFILKGKWGAKDRAILTSTNKNLKPYRGQVTREAVVALEAAGFPQPMAEKHVPVSMAVDFYFAKPPTVPKKRKEMVVTPDLSKLIRSTEDALIGLLYFDDAQIVETVARKHYGTPERVEVLVKTVDHLETAEERSSKTTDSFSTRSDEQMLFDMHHNTAFGMK